MRKHRGSLYVKKLSVGWSRKRAGFKPAPTVEASGGGGMKSGSRPSRWWELAERGRSLGEVGEDADVVAGAFEGEVANGGAGAGGGVGDDFVHASDSDVSEALGQLVVGAQ